jgi:hypothetical protein
MERKGLCATMVVEEEHHFLLPVIATSFAASVRALARSLNGDAPAVGWNVIVRCSALHTTNSEATTK